MGEIIKFICPENICISQKCEDELITILTGSGLEGKFMSQFRQRIKFLETHGRNCIQKTDWFEKLKEANDIYSMRFKLPKNIRILFTIRANKISILLCSFEEKGSNKKGKNGYSQNIEVAITRLTYLE